jgi:hypothetical protein
MQLLTSNIVYSKKQIIQMKKIVLSLMLITASGAVFAQINKKKEKTVTVTTDVSDAEIKGKKKVKIVKNINGKTEVIEKIIDADSLNSPDGIIILDSKGEEMGGNTNIIIKMDSTGEQVWEGGGRKNKNIRIQKFNKGERLGQNMGREFDIQMENLHDVMSDLPRNIRNQRMYIYDDNNVRTIPNKGIKSLDVYTNQPETHIINVRFTAPTEGDVKITVIDLEGKVISKLEEKAFKGEYMDQVRLPKDTKGTFFVIVSQGDDGISRKVKVGEKTMDKE